MGGGGGGFFSGDYSPSEYRKILRESEEQTENVQFETDVNSFLNDLLGEYNRDAERTNEHLLEIDEIIASGLGGTINMKFGGSVHKHTYVDGLSDVDILVEINRSELFGASPAEVLEYIKEELKNSGRRNISDVKVGMLAVTVTFSDNESIQLLPALKNGDGYKISKENGEWSKIIRPDIFAKKLTEINRRCNNKVVPVIKLAKDIIYQLPEEQRLNGYHIESIAVEAFKKYPDSEAKTTKKMLKYFFEKAKDIVNEPIRDSTHQSLHVDDYLGEAGSVERKRTSYVLDRIFKRMKNADLVGSMDEWKSILG
ncbi:MAG: CBASS oligonucleotide cyclase [Thermoplasmataceae archaeon]